MTKYKDFFQNIRDATKDVLDDAGAEVVSTVLGRFTLRGLRKIMGMFPEARMDASGRMGALPETAYAETTAGEIALPIPPEFEPALEAYVLAAIYGLDAADVKDESLFKHWQGVFKALVGER